MILRFGFAGDINLFVTVYGMHLMNDSVKEIKYVLIASQFKQKFTRDNYDYKEMFFGETSQ